MATTETASQLPLFENRRPEIFHLTLSSGVKLDLEDAAQLALAKALQLGRGVRVTIAPEKDPNAAVVFAGRVSKRAFNDRDVPSTVSHVSVLKVADAE